MCDPVTMSLIAAGITASTTIAGGIAAQSAAKQQARNLQIEGRQALQVGNVEANRIREAGERELGTTRSIQAKAGVDIGSGSAADVGADIAGVYDQDALFALYGGRLRAWQKNAAAAQAKFEGKQALTSSLISAGGTLLGGAIDGGLFSSKAPTQKFINKTGYRRSPGFVSITPQRGTLY